MAYRGARIDTIYISSVLSDQGDTFTTHQDTNLSDHAPIQYTMFSRRKPAPRVDSFHAGTMRKQALQECLTQAWHKEVKPIAGEPGGEHWMDWVSLA